MEPPPDNWPVPASGLAFGFLAWLATWNSFWLVPASVAFFVGIYLAVLCAMRDR